MVPGYLLVTQIGLLDMLAALVIPHAASAFAVFVLLRTLRAFPLDLIEAAVVDVAGHGRILRAFRSDGIIRTERIRARSMS